MMVVPQPWSISAPSLLTLPLEIQTNILRHVHQCSPRSIQPVLRTCKSLYDIALPFSVHTFRYLGNNVNGSQIEGAEHDVVAQGTLYRPGKIMMFLRYIAITKPHLASSVRCLILGDFGTYEDGQHGDQDLSHEELSIYQAMIDETFHSGHTGEWEIWRSEWLEGLTRGVEDEQISLLLIACTNLEQLVVGEPYKPRMFLRLLGVAGQTGIQMRTRNPPMTSSVPLCHLQQLYLESQESKYGYLMWSEFAKAFAIPALRSLEVVMANGSDNSAEGFKNLPSSSSNVEEIILRKSCIVADVLHSMTRACKGLRSLEYTRGVYHMYDAELMPRDVLEAVLPHAKTLHYLHLNFEDDWQKNGWEDHPGKLYMGVEMKELTALRKLVVGMQSLTGMLDCQPEEIFSERVPLEVDGAPEVIECVPENLEHLEIHGCGKVILPQAQNLLDEIARGKYPNLKHLRLLFNREHITLDDIHLRCHNSSVKLDIRLQSRENRIYDLIPYSTLGGFVQNVCTRIYSRDARQKWLDYRCSDVASATVNGGVFDEPGHERVE